MNRSRACLRRARSSTTRDETVDTVERLMGNKPEARFLFIQERAAFATKSGLYLTVAGNADEASGIIAGGRGGPGRQSMAR